MSATYCVVTGQAVAFVDAKHMRKGGASFVEFTSERSRPRLSVGEQRNSRLAERNAIC
jgi:hypothetical protein